MAEDLKRYAPILCEKLKGRMNLVRYPLWASIKLDGYRCVTIPPAQGDSGCRALARSLAPIRNDFIRKYIEQHCCPGLDGELMVRGSTHFGMAGGQISRKTGAPDFVFNVFDLMNDDLSYIDRVEVLQEISMHLPKRVQLVLPKLIENQEQLMELYERALADGHEGLVLRRGNGCYKHSRSTMSEFLAVAMKLREDMEVEIIGCTELLHNENEAGRDALGHTKRGSSKDGMRESSMLGSLEVQTLDGSAFGAGVVFNVGTGIDDETRRLWWQMRDELVGRMLTVTYHVTGIKERPREPAIKGLRDPLDI